MKKIQQILKSTTKWRSKAAALH